MHDAHGPYGPIQPLHVRRIGRCSAAVTALWHFALSRTRHILLCMLWYALGYTERLRRRACLTRTLRIDSVCCSGGVCMAIGGYRCCAQLVYEDDDNITDLTPRNCSDYCWADQVW